MDLVRRMMQRLRRHGDGDAPSPPAVAKRVRTAFRLDEDGWQQLVADASAGAETWDRSDWWELPVRDRVALYCTAFGDWDAVERLAESRTVHGPSFLVSRDTHRIDLGEPVEAPGWLFAAQEHDLVARVSIEVAGSSPVYVAGTSFISGLAFDPEADSVRVVAVTSGGAVVPEVTMRPDSAADAESGERWADQTHASWWTRLDVDRSEPITLTVTIESDGVVRHGEIVVPALDASAATVAMRPTDAGVELVAEGIEVRVASLTEEWCGGPVPLTLDARTDRFGTVATIPAARYAVTSTVPLDLADPAVLALPLAERAADLVDLLVTLRGWSPGEADVSVVVRNPIPVEHRGRRRQRLLLAEVREQAGPLRDRAVAMCFGGSGAGDSVAPVARELVRRGIPVDWCVTDHSVAVPDGMRPVLLHSREWHEAFTHARYLVNNAEFPHYVRFREGQRYLQTWHGTPLKQIARDVAAPRFSAGYSAAMAREVVAWEALVAQNAYAGEVLPRAFGFSGRTLIEGYPRNDALATDDGTLRDRTRAALGLGDELVVLYAPTWRDGARDSSGRRAFVSHLDAGAVHERTGATVLLRSHSNAAAARGRLTAPGVVDVTTHPDITSLLAAADVLVTDYSSVMFDFAVTGRPQILLVPDAAEYRAERGFYLNLEESPPGPIVTSTDEVVALLAEPGSLVVPPQFRQRFAPLDDGGATSRVVDAWLGPQDPSSPSR